MYQFVGKTAPFLVLACLALGDGRENTKLWRFCIPRVFIDWLSRFQVLQLMVLQPAVAHQEEKPPSVKELLMDPYIIVAAGNWFRENVVLDCLDVSVD